MDAHDIHAGGRIFFRVFQHHAQDLRRGDVDVQVGRRKILVARIEEKRLHNPVEELLAALFQRLGGEVFGIDPKWEA